MSRRFLQEIRLQLIVTCLFFWTFHSMEEDLDALLLPRRLAHSEGKRMDNDLGRETGNELLPLSELAFK